MIKNLTLSAAIILASSLGINAAQVIYHTPSNYQVLSVSPNGYWACGVFQDAALNTYGFRWNLLSGKIEMLSSTDTSIAWDVADDGTVSGNFADNSITPNGAPIQMVGYYRDGSWHSVEMPDGKITDGLGYGITPDGRYISGSVQVDGIYTPIIWHDGKISRILSRGAHGMPYTIAPDGQSAAGWHMTRNRVATYWGADGKPTYLTDSPKYSYTPWNSARAFSPDGKKLLYWGGWDELEDGNLNLYCVYDLETGERTKVQAPSIESDMEFFDITADGVLLGADKGRGYVYLPSEGKSVYIDEYLKMRGADLSKFDDMYVGDNWDETTLPISRAASASADGSVIAMMYWDKTGQTSSMVLKIDYDTDKAPATDISAAQIPGLSTVGLTWAAPDRTAGNTYNVYRDGRRVSSMLGLRTTYYYDTDVDGGRHEYAVERVTPGGTRTMSETVSVEVAPAAPESPRDILSRQKGVNSAFAQWAEPLNNMTHISYSRQSEDAFIGFSVYQDVKMEAAVKFNSHLIDNYKGQAIRAIKFCPMSEHKTWEINIYTQAADGTLTKVYSQPIEQKLNIGKYNTVTLSQPLSVPVGGGDLIAAVSVEVDSENGSQVLGAEMGPVNPGYTDLLRQAGEPVFYSAYERSLESSYTCTCMTWGITLDIAPDSYSEADNVLTHYNVYVDGEKATETTDTRAVVTGLPDGPHTISVEGVYANGAVSNAATSHIEIKGVYPAVNDLTISTDNEASSIKATWNAPTDADVARISYTDQTHSTQGIKGSSYNGYAIQGASLYPASRLKGYDGYRIKSLSFYPLSDAVFSLALYAGDEEVAFIEVEDYVLGEWNEVEVTDDVIIQAGKNYRFVVDCFDPVPDRDVLAVDNNPGFIGYSDLYSVNNGESFSTLSTDTGVNANLMMAMTIESMDNTLAPAQSYDLVVDGRKCNTEPIAATEYSYTMPESEASEHTARIDTYYPARAEAVEGGVTTFFIRTNSIADNIIAEISLRQGENRLTATGEGVQALTIFSNTGQQVARAQGDTIDITAMPKGVYMVKVATANGNVTRKVIIK